MAAIAATVSSLSPLARDILSKSDAASILGVTSRGIFLEIGRRWVIFLSSETSRGPLTLNLDRAIPTPGEIDQTQSVEIAAGQIRFSAPSLVARFAAAQDWVVSPHPLPVLDRAERDRRTRAIGRELIARRGGTGLLPVLAELLDLDVPGPPDQPALVSRFRLHTLSGILRSPDASRIAAALGPFLGLGSGLTPSGDDFICGLLLACNRYADAFNLAVDPGRLNQAMVESAYRKTGLLSANLIEAASTGQADERLLLALDGMLTGIIEPARCAEHLLRWGNSSGCDAFVGMALAAHQL